MRWPWALALMGRKLTAAQALEGKFSTEGLVSMAGEDANVEIALARSLVDHLDEGDARRLWGKVFNPGGCSNGHVIPPAIVSEVQDVTDVQRLTLFEALEGNVIESNPSGHCQQWLF